jgi:hypothetical protein
MPRPPADHWITPPCRGTAGITARSLLLHPERAASSATTSTRSSARCSANALQSPKRAISVRSTSTSELGSTTPPAGSVPTSRTHFASGCTSGSTPRAASRPRAGRPVHRLHGPRTGRRSWRRRAGRAARPRRQRGGPRRRSGRRSRPPGASSRPAVGVEHEGAWCWIGHGSGASLRVLVQGPAGVAVTASGTGRAHRGAALLSSRPSARVMARGRHS